MQILVLDDDPSTLDIFELVAEILSEHQFHLCSNFEHVKNCLYQSPIDIALLDIVMPDIDGFEVLRFLRQTPQAQKVYVILMSGDRNQLLDRVRGYNLQAQDFQTKPFDIQELVMMLKSKITYIQTLQPTSSDAFKIADVVEHGKFQLNHKTRGLFYENKPIPLSDMEYYMMSYFFSHPQEILSLEQLIRDIWHERTNQHSITDTNVRSLVYKLRQKIEENPHYPVYLINAKYNGYIFYPDGLPST